MGGKFSVHPDRAAAAREVGKMIATDRGRNYLARNGYRDGIPIVTALESDRLANVMTYINRTYGGDESASVLLAVYWPDKQVLRLALASTKDRRGSADDEPDSDGESVPLGTTTSLGMVFDTFGRSQRRWVDSADWAPPVELRKLPALV